MVRRDRQTPSKSVIYPESDTRPRSERNNPHALLDRASSGAGAILDPICGTIVVDMENWIVSRLVADWRTRGGRGRRTMRWGLRADALSVLSAGAVCLGAILSEHRHDDATKEGWMTRTRGCPGGNVLAGGRHEAEGEHDRRTLDRTSKDTRVWRSRSVDHWRSGRARCLILPQ